MYRYVHIPTYPWFGYVRFSEKKKGMCGLVFAHFWREYGLNHAEKCREIKDIGISDQKYRLAAPAAS